MPIADRISPAIDLSPSFFVREYASRIGRITVKTSFVIASLTGLLATFPASATPVASLCDQVVGNIVGNCGFEGSNFSPWIRTETLHDSIGRVINFPHSGNVAAGFSNANTPVEMLDQVLATTPGQRYTFSFFEAFGGGTMASFFANWDGITELSVTAPTTNQYEFHSFSVVATSTATHIQFGQTSSNAGFDLDDVVVTSDAPEPAEFALTGAALIGLAIGLARDSISLRPRRAR